MNGVRETAASLTVAVTAKRYLIDLIRFHFVHPNTCLSKVKPHLLVAQCHVQNTLTNNLNPRKSGQPL